MRIAAEATEEVVHLLMDHRVTGDRVFKVFQLFRGRQVTVEQQEADPAMSEALALSAQFHRGEIGSDEAINRMLNKYPMDQLQRVWSVLNG